MAHNLVSLGSGSRPKNARQEPARSALVKQTYSVYVDTSRGRRKWHLSMLISLEGGLC